MEPFKDVLQCPPWGQLYGRREMLVFCFAKDPLPELVHYVTFQYMVHSVADTVRYLLTDCGVNVNAVDDSGETALAALIRTAVTHVCRVLCSVTASLAKRLCGDFSAFGGPFRCVWCPLAAEQVCRPVPLRNSGVAPAETVPYRTLAPCGDWCLGWIIFRSFGAVLRY